jgi:hypothetical protein
VLYELLTSKQPFAQNSVAATASAILTHEPPPLSEAPLQQVVFKCIEKVRERRYPTMNEVVRDLDRATQEITKANTSEDKFRSETQQ